MPETTKELFDSLASIKWIDKHDRCHEYINLCHHLRIRPKLFMLFFTMNPYSYQHATVAAWMYAEYGQTVYSEIRSLVPQILGNIFSNWDEFFLRQVDEITWISTYSIANHKTLIIRFINDIEELCDDDLYIEVLCKLSRTATYPNPLNRNECTIDYEFMKRRYPTIGKTRFGMQRFVQLLEALADYDYVGAFQAWGDFYYLFEDVYEQSPPKNKSFTGALYNALFVVPQHKVLDWSENDVDKEPVFQKCRDKINSLINLKGWDVLHHAFEINTDADYCLRWIYDNLSLEDKKKADAAREKRKRKAIPSVQSCVQKKEEQKNRFSIIVGLFQEDMNVAFSTWRSFLEEMVSSQNVPKYIMKESLDGILNELMKQQYQSGKEIEICCPKAPLIKEKVPPVCLALLQDDWLTDFYFSHFQLYGGAKRIASIPLLCGDLPRFEKIRMAIIKNEYCTMPYNSIMKHIHDAATNNARYLQWQIDNHLRIYEDLSNCSLSLNRSFQSERIDTSEHPKFIEQVQYVLSFCAEHI